jgi:hypothetical protein
MAPLNKGVPLHRVVDHVEGDQEHFVIFVRAPNTEELLTPIELRQWIIQVIVCRERNLWQCLVALVIGS